MYFLSEVTILFLSFVTSLSNTTYDEIHQKDSIQDSYSMIVSIRYDWQDKNKSILRCCTGTILTNSYILTTADCIDSVPNGLTIHSQSESYEIIRTIDQIIIHPNWTNDRSNLKHNLALLHLVNPLDFIQTNLSLSQHLSNDIPLLAIEWNIAKDDFDTTMLGSLQQTEVFYVDYNDPTCNKLIDNIEQQFCVRSYPGNKSSCNHQSGQPILQWIENRWLQIGIVTSVAEKISQSCLNICTRLAYYQGWIESVLHHQSLTSFRSALTIISMMNKAVTYECNFYTTSCGCSATNVQLSSTKIIGGEEAIPYSWSMIVSIHLNDSEEHSCGGSILTESYILTSADCIDDSIPTDIYIVAGIHNRVEDFPMKRYAHQVYIHPNWNRSDSSHQDDIALLYIFPPLSINGNQFLARTCVPYSDSFNEIVNCPSNGSHLVMIGWGSTEYDNHNMSDTLQQTSIYTIDHNDPICLNSIENVEKQFCTEMNGKSPCYGDLGGPILEWKDTYWEQVGIISNGGKCDWHDSPGIFTRLSYYFNWMESAINRSLTTTTLKPPPSPILYECNKTSSCGCGKTDVALTPSRIVGGENALEDSWPMIVSIRLNGANDHSCGGTILSNSYILTAAHCFRRVSIEHPVGITIAAGMTNRSDPLQIVREIDRIYMHPNYTNISGDYRHDIALLHLAQPVGFESNSSLTKTCIHRIDPSIPTNSYPKNGTFLAIIGWGVLRFGTTYVPEILQQAQVSTIDNQNSICLNSINNTDLQFCAGLFEGGKDSCQGDSGGPIFQWTGQYWEQVGIVSNGRGCANPNFPGIYTRLSYYYQWIEDILKRDNEYIEPHIPSYTTTVDPNITTTADPTVTITFENTTSYWISSSIHTTTVTKTIPNNTYKYEFRIYILRTFVFLLLFI